MYMLYKLCIKYIIKYISYPLNKFGQILCHTYDIQSHIYQLVTGLQKLKSQIYSLHMSHKVIYMCI